MRCNIDFHSTKQLCEILTGVNSWQACRGTEYKFHNFWPVSGCGKQ